MARVQKLAWHTGKAAWQFGTSFLILGALVIQLHREEQMMALEQEQMGVLQSPTGNAEPTPTA